MSFSLTINGETRSVDADSIWKLLQGEGLNPEARGLAVALNGAVLPPLAAKDWETNDAIDEAFDHCRRNLGITPVRGYRRLSEPGHTAALAGGQRLRDGHLVDPPREP